jgi:hypothetical protein
MRSVGRVRSRLELDERARSARRGLEEAERELAADRPRVGLRDWLLAVMGCEPGAREGPDELR